MRSTGAIRAIGSRRLIDEADRTLDGKLKALRRPTLRGRCRYTAAFARRVIDAEVALRETRSADAVAARERTPRISSARDISDCLAHLSQAKRMIGH